MSELGASYGLDESFKKVYTATVFLRQDVTGMQAPRSRVRVAQAHLGIYLMDADDHWCNIRSVQDNFSPQDRTKILGFGLGTEWMSEKTWHRPAVRHWQRLHSYLFMAAVPNCYEAKAPHVEDIPATGIGTLSIPGLGGDIDDPAIYLPMPGSSDDIHPVTRAIELTGNVQRPVYAALRQAAGEILLSHAALRSNDFSEIILPHPR